MGWGEENNEEEEKKGFWYGFAIVTSPKRDLLTRVGRGTLDDHESVHKGIVVLQPQLQHFQLIVEHEAIHYL